MAPLTERLQLPKVVARWQEIEGAFVPSYQEYIRMQIEEQRSGQGVSE